MLRVAPQASAQTNLPAPRERSPDAAVGSLSYAVVTPARDEAGNLPRLALALSEQTVPPKAWVIVENGSSDGTLSIAESLRDRHRWIRVVTLPGDDRPVRGAPIVRAFTAGLDALVERPSVVVKLDADVSFDPDYFERLLAAFEADPLLGIASGSAHGLEGGSWKQRHVTGSSVWGATRAYRRECLDHVVPLEEHMGWDGIDEVKARLRGWRTATLTDTPFYHHRLEGQRDGTPARAWAARGRAARYMGYRAWYLTLRALHHTRRDPRALAMVLGFAAAAVMREPVCSDPEVRTQLRREQNVRELARRRRQALGLHPSERRA